MRAARALFQGDGAGREVDRRHHRYRHTRGVAVSGSSSAPCMLRRPDVICRGISGHGRQYGFTPRTLAAAQSLWSRRIVGWSMGPRIDAELVTRALDAAWRRVSRVRGCCITVTGACSTRAINSTGPEASGDQMQHEPEGELLGQCADGELLREAEAGMGLWPHLSDSGIGAAERV
mgnify:CR=1 FL=1